MIHFFPRFSRNADDTPFGQTLRALGVEHRIFAANQPQNYRHRWALLFIGYPRLAWTALTGAVRSLASAGPAPPDAAVISSDVEALVFAFVRLLPFAAKARLVFVPFIFTQRASPALNRVRLAYYRLVMWRVDLAICHSSLEVERYRMLFAGGRTRFVFVPWGGYVPTVAAILASTQAPARHDGPEVVSAGKSGRDYPTLAEAARMNGCRLVIICNEKAALADVPQSPGIEVLSDCFGMDYLGRLLRADIVAVPLRVEDISAGQMVLIQAMALARPLIATDTPTIRDYLEDGVTALLVPRGDAAAMAAAIHRLLGDPQQAKSLGERARQRYEAEFSAVAHLRALVRAIEGDPAGS